MRRFARRHPWFCAAFAACSALVLWPLWTVEYLPLLDWPQHMASVSLLAHYFDPEWGFSEHYVLDPKITTYLTLYAGGALLAQIVGVDAAVRLLLSTFLVGTPAALAWLLRIYGRSPWAALPAFVAVWCWPLYMGFGAYVMGVPLLLLGIGLIQKTSEKPTPRRRRWLAVVSTLLFFTHALGYGLLLAVGGLCAVAFNLRRPRRILSIGVAMIPSLLAFGIWFGTQFLSAHESEIGAGIAMVHAHGSGEPFGIEYQTFEQKKETLAFYFNEAFRSADDTTIEERFEDILAYLALAGLFLAFLRWRRWIEPVRGAPRGWRPLFVAALLVGLYFAMPMAAVNIWAISPRMIVVGACGLLLAIPMLFRKELLNALLFAPVMLLVYDTAVLNHDQFEAFQQETEGLDETLEAMPRGERVYGLVFASGSPTMSQAVFLHYPAYYMVERGGLVGFTFLNVPGVPMHVRTLGASPYPGRRGEWEPRRFRYDLYGRFYDQIFVRGSVRSTPAMIGAPPGALRLVHQAGPWGVFENTRASEATVYSFRENVHTARVTYGPDGDERLCGPWEAGKHACTHAEWVYVGPSEQNFAGTLVPCIWAHPITGQTLRITYDGVPADGNLLHGFYGVADTGHYRPGADVELSITVDGQPITAVRGGASRGYQTFEAPVPIATSPRQVVVDVTTPDDAGRHFCFGATLFDVAEDAR